MKFLVVLFTSLLVSTHSQLRKYPSTKIVGGEEVVNGRYPYQVAFVESLTAKLPFCGGSLVAPDWVLTAAHCKVNEGYAVIGRHDFSDSSETGYETIEILWQKKHPSYNSKTLNNDFMMMKLANASNFEPVTLDTGLADVSSGIDVTVMGWGTTKFGGSQSDMLLEVEMDIVSNDDCGRAYGGDITGKMMCAARDGKDSCQGDSGGPLIIKGPDASADVLVGVVSWGYRCAMENYPGVYARVSSVISWIQNEIDNGVDPVDDDTPSSGGWDYEPPIYVDDLEWPVIGFISAMLSLCFG